MKKTLITLAALAMASVAVADTISTKTDGYTTEPAVVCGWIGSLTDSYLTSTNGLTDVSLSSIAVQASGTHWQGWYTNDVKLAVFTYSDISSKGSLVGLSDSAVAWTENAPLTFSFSDVTLDADTTYRFLFVKSESTAESISTSTLGDLYQSRRLELIEVGSGDAILTAEDSATTLVHAGFLPNVTYTYTVSPTGGDAVPEPTTATLSLLALAGLAARRRRK